MRKNSVRIVGVSDGAPLEKAFRSSFGKSYSNFEYHTEPFLDITCVDESLESSAKIVVCSEVLEHVQPPIGLAFQGLYQLLKPGGWVVLSVPHRGPNSKHEEHFPIMKSFEITADSIPILKGVDEEGNEREFSGLVFHGGEGATLEFRVFSESSVRTNLEKSGFRNILVDSDYRMFGCQWEPWSRVWIAQKPLL